MPQSANAYVQSEELTNVVIAAKPKGLIADKVLPRTAPMASTKFSYFEFADAQFFTVPDASVGRKSKVNEVDFEGTKKTDETLDYGLSHKLSNRDQKSAVKLVSPEARVAEWIANLVALGREVRVANMVFDPAIYGSNTETLGAADQFNNASADLVGLISDVLDNPIMRPNNFAIGERAWGAMRRNPSIVSAILGNSGTKGIASRQAVAELFEVDEILVGRGRINTSKPGQTPSFGRAWSDGLAMFYQDPIAVKTIDSESTSPAATFGFTAQFGEKVGYRKEDDEIGLHGGIRIKAGESIKEVIAAPSFAYYFHNVMA